MLTLTAKILPIKKGKDIFEFQVFENGEIIPMGSAGWKTMWAFSFCSKNSTGNGCAAWVILKGNMDYLKRPVSWEE